MKTVCIMGGGLGGLMTGALLTKEGFRVTVVEKNSHIGGGLQSFRRGKANFDVGMHLVGGMHEGGQMRRILRYLGIDSQRYTTPYNDTIVYLGDTPDSITLPNGREAWIDAFCRRHGGSAEVRRELEEYVDHIYRLTEIEELFSLSPLKNPYLDMPTLSAKELIGQHISSPTLRRELAYTVPLYSGTTDSPALLHSTVNVLHIEGTHTFALPSQQLADALADLIRAAGGEIVTSSEIKAVETSGRQATAAISADGKYSADIFVSDIPVAELVKLVPKGAFSPAFVKRASEMPYSYSAFSVYLTLAPHTMRCKRQGYYISYPDTDPWNVTDCEESQWPRNAFMLTNADPDDPDYAATMTIICPMDYRMAARFEGHRTDSYRQWKQRMATAAISMVEQAVGKVSYIATETASPITIHDYFHAPMGAIYGKHPTVLNPALTTISTNTRLQNLFITGQDVNFHGLVGVSLTAILTAESIVGRNVIVNKINEEEKQTI